MTEKKRNRRFFIRLSLSVCSSVTCCRWIFMNGVIAVHLTGFFERKRNEKNTIRCLPIALALSRFSTSWEYLLFFVEGSKVKVHDRFSTTSDILERKQVRKRMKSARTVNRFHYLFWREKHRAVVIGGGWSGLYALKYLLGEGIDAHLYESRADIGGIWRFDESEQIGGVYKSAHATSSKTFLHASDFPFPSDTPEFPSHQEVLTYLHTYADHFQLWPNIHLNSKIERVEPRWVVTINSGSQIIECDYVVVCSGQHQTANDPRDTHPFDKFTGTFSHSISYKSPYHEQFVNKRLLIVGGGETGSDLAVELSSTVATSVHMSIREGQWFQARVLGQQPADVMYTMLMRIWGYYNNIFVRCWRRMFFVPMWGVGGTGVREWKPKVAFLHGFINKSREVVDHIALKRVTPKGGIAKIDGKSITFVGDPNPVSIDHILLCTGYRYVHPFFPHTDIHDLYKLVFASGVKGTLAFVGSARPVFGSIPALSEIQARWVAAVFAGRRWLPSEKVMARRRRVYWERHARLYPHDDKRLKQLVNLFEYTDVIGDELGVRLRVFYLFFRHPLIWFHVYCRSPWSPFLFRMGRLSSKDEKLAYQRHLACVPAKDQTFHRMNDVFLYAWLGMIVCNFLCLLIGIVFLVCYFFF